MYCIVKANDVYAIKPNNQPHCPSLLRLPDESGKCEESRRSSSSSGELTRLWVREEKIAARVLMLHDWGSISW